MSFRHACLLIAAFVPLVTAAVEVPNRDDIEILREAVRGMVPQGYRAGPYNDSFGTRGFVVSRKAALASDRLKEAPAIEVIIYAFVPEAEWRRLNAETQRATAEFQALPTAQKDKRRKEFLQRMHDLPAAHFRSIGISLIHRGAFIEDEKMKKLYELEVLRLKEFEEALLKVVTLYDKKA